MSIVLIFDMVLIIKLLYSPIRYLLYCTSLVSKVMLIFYIYNVKGSQRFIAYTRWHSLLAERYQSVGCVSVLAMERLDRRREYGRCDVAGFELKYYMNFCASKQLYMQLNTFVTVLWGFLSWLCDICGVKYFHRAYSFMFFYIKACPSIFVCWSV